MRSTTVPWRRRLCAAVKDGLTGMTALAPISVEVVKGLRLGQGRRARGQPRDLMAQVRHQP
jgi:hypothetical protein